MKNLFICLFLITMCGEICGQEELQVEITMHDVKPGETVRTISKRYLVSPSDIYQLNKFAVNGISPGMVLHIPRTKKSGSISNQTKATAAVELLPVNDNGSVLADEDLEKVMDAVKSESETKNSLAKKPMAAAGSNSAVPHKVKAGETLSLLSSKYGISVAEIKEHNADLLTGGLKAGQTILIPSRGGIETDEAIATTAPSTEVIGEIYEHTVEPKETLYSISKKYNVSVDEIKKQNEKLLAHGLQAGQVIKIKAK